MEYKEKYKKIEKIIRGGDITKEGWYKINKLFDGIRECEIYTIDHMANDIIQYYQRLYESNPKRKRMNHNDLKSKIREILENLRALSNEKADRIWSPSSTARDYFGFSQKHLEKIIRGKI